MPVTENWPTLPGPSDDNYSFTETPRVRSAQFGDGYEVRAQDGINANPRTFTMDWPNLESADYTTAIEFLRARNGTEAFNWTPPHEVTSIKVKCPTWTPKPSPGGSYWSLAVTFVQVYDQ